MEGDGAVLGEAAGEVDGSIGGLLPENGEERENEESETDVNRGRNKQTLCIHIYINSQFLLGLDLWIEMSSIWGKCLINVAESHYSDVA